MSYGLRLENKDLSFDGSGKVTIVANEEKLVQGISKLLLTEQGRNFIHQLYGSDIYGLLGKKMKSTTINSLLSSRISKLVTYFMSIQGNQQINQSVDPKEILKAVESIVVERADANRIIVRVNMRTQQGTQVSALIPVTDTNGGGG